MTPPYHPACSKKNELQPHKKKCWMIPPQQNGEFVAAMEDVLDIYERPYNEKYPVVCMDEQPDQLIGEELVSLPMQPGQPLRYDHQYVSSWDGLQFYVFPTVKELAASFGA